MPVVTAEDLTSVAVALEKFLQVCQCEWELSSWDPASGNCASIFRVFNGLASAVRELKQTVETCESSAGGIWGARSC